MERQVTIYALCDPDTDAIRYIGQSINAATRLQTHIDCAFRGISKRDSWIRSLLRKGRLPKLKVLHVADASEADQLETSAIHQALEQGCELVNSRLAAVGGVTTRSAERAERAEKVTLSIKVSGMTMRQIEELRHRYGSVETLITIAIDRLHRNH